MAILVSWFFASERLSDLCLAVGMLLICGADGVEVIGAPPDPVPGTARPEAPSAVGRVRKADVPEPAPFTLEIDVLVQPNPSFSITAQQWGRIFQDVGYSVRFREGRLGERTRVEDLKREDSRTTLIVGILEQDGRILIRDQHFTFSDGQKFREFAQQVARYGAAGPPETSPRWGLSEEQFSDVTQLLSVPISSPVVLTSPSDTITSLQLPAEFRIRFTQAAMDRRVSTRRNEAVRGDTERGKEIDGADGDKKAPTEPDNLTGFSKGSALSLILARFGLGFRPLVDMKVQDGSGYILEVDVGDESSNLWPVGWKTKEAVNVVVPGLYKAIPVSADDFPLNELISVIAGKLNVPVFYSSFVLNEAGIIPEELRYTRKPEKISPQRLMQLLGDRYQIGLDIRADERGRCFLWVTTREEFLAFRQRFAHIIPGKQ